jgi:hypothetical protein
VVVSLFGESSIDKRDFRMGLAGLLAGIHSLRILAERGIASAEDIGISQQGIEQVLSSIPESEFAASERAKLLDMLDKIRVTAASNFRQEA